jgi:hypothetical protein
MSFSAEEKEAINTGRIDYYNGDGTTQFLAFTVATEFQRTGQANGETWLDWVQRHVDSGQMSIRIWDPDRY